MRFEVVCVPQGYSFDPFPLKPIFRTTLLGYTS